MKKLSIILILSFLIFIFAPYAAAQEGSLTFDFASGSPIFTVENMLPGDTEQESVTVTNTADVPKQVAVRGTKTETSPEPPYLEDILTFEISENPNALYGSGSTTGERTLSDFFTDSADGLELITIPAGDSRTIIFNAHFPSSAGNEFQGKRVVFDLTFMEPFVPEAHLVINEVYYFENDDPGEGGYCPSRPINASIIGNGRGSVNSINLSFFGQCVIVQGNSANARNNVNIGLNTGGNMINGGSVTTGKASAGVNILNRFNLNIGNCECQGANKDYEWIELYNPTDERVKIKKASIMNSDSFINIGNINLKPGQYAIVAPKDAFHNLDTPKGVKEIKVKNWFTGGLNNEGGHLILESEGNDLDAVGWGSNIIWPDSPPLAAKSNSIVRISAGYDTDMPYDWVESASPTPGF